jgi:hypothetical protein
MENPMRSFTVLRNGSYTIVKAVNIRDAAEQSFGRTGPDAVEVAYPNASSVARVSMSDGSFVSVYLSR